MASCFVNGILTCLRLALYLRVHFKVLVLMYKALFGLDPVYLSNYLSSVFSFKSSNYLESFELRCLQLCTMGQGTSGRSLVVIWLCNTTPQDIPSSGRIISFSLQSKLHVQKSYIFLSCLIDCLHVRLIQPAALVRLLHFIVNTFKNIPCES